MLALALLALAPASAPPAPAVTGLRYELVFTKANAASRSVDVITRFAVSAAGDVELSLPAWTPGAYEISNFARQVSAFAVTQDGAAVRWDKADFDTWRLAVPAAGPVEVSFTFAADTLDNAMAWSRPDFLLVNGTNVFLYPEGAGLDFAASVTVRTEPDWKVVTGMKPTGGRAFQASNYHDLVDMPFFIGRVDVDSARVDGVWHRLASWPAGTLQGPARQLLWSQLQTMVPAEARVFQETPWESYTTMVIFDSAYGGGSALEHQSSHVGIYNPQFIGTALLASITAHEIFHAWNVKRLRPAEMVPYRYDRPEPTTLLWVSEGITDYYADLALVRGGIIDSTVFLNVTQGKMEEVGQVPPVALEDASLSTWIHPTDGTSTIYYPKGSLAGFLLDIMIRDASDNRASLDDVMRNLYRTVYKAGRGFTVEAWWQAVSAAAQGRSFDEFYRRYVDGREPFPWARVAPMAGLRFQADTIHEARIGITSGGSAGGGAEVVTSVAPGSAAQEAGIQVSDTLVSVGSVKVDPTFGARFRATYKSRIGETIPVVVRRDGREVTLSMTVREATRVEERLEFDRSAGPKAARIRAGILRGTTDR